MALHLWRQIFPSSISTLVDSDFAGCRLTRKSTTGMVQIIGEHAVKHTSNLQGATLSVSECEYYALTHSAAHCLGLKAYMMDVGFAMSLQIFSDSSAKALASRHGLGRTSATCADTLPVLEEKVKVKGAQNSAGILTKAACRETPEKTQKDVGTTTSRSTQQPERTQAGKFGQKIRQSCQGHVPMKSRDFGSAGMVRRFGTRME